MLARQGARVTLSREMLVVFFMLLFMLVMCTAGYPTEYNQSTLQSPCGQPRPLFSLSVCWEVLPSFLLVCQLGGEGVIASAEDVAAARARAAVKWLRRRRGRLWAVREILGDG